MWKNKTKEEVLAKLAGRTYILHHPVGDRFLRFLWRLEKFSQNFTHRPVITATQIGDIDSYEPREWFKLFMRMTGQTSLQPWLWCRCGDGLETWQEFRDGRCISCQDYDSSSWRAT